MAERICRAWRRYSTVRIYRYYRDLIRFRERGDPAVLLRAVNPREANMSDAACGVHVRFRLGGATFPPLIFYKIYTHRPVTDMCAFSPRDYVAAALEKKSRRHTKSKPAGFGRGDLFRRVRRIIHSFVFARSTPQTLSADVSACSFFFNTGRLWGGE